MMRQSELQERLRASEERAAAAQRLGRIGGAEFDFRSGRSYWSGQAYAIFGIEPGSVTPGLDTFLTLLPPTERPRFRAIAEEARGGQPIANLEIRIVRPDGQGRWLSMASDVVRADDGSVLKVLATFQDISERKQVEDELQRQSQRLEAVQRTAGVAYMERDLATLETFWSDEVYRLLGAERGAIAATPRSFMDAVHPDDRGMVRDVRQKLGRGEDVAPFELRVIRRDGETRWVGRRDSIIRDAAGKPLRVITTMVDITASKRSEEDMRASQAHLARSQRLGMFGSAEVDYRTGKSYWSDELFRIFDLEPGEPPPFETLLALLHPDDRDRLTDVHERGLAAKDAPPIELRAVLPDGRVRWLRRYAETFLDTEGKPAKLMVSYQDVTAPKRMETDLFRAQKMEAMGQLTGGIAHDFNNILSIMIGNLDLLRDELPPGSAAIGLIDGAIRAGLKGSELTRSLLAFARSQPLQPRRVDINVRLRDLMKILASAAGESVVIDLEPAADLWPVHIDPAQLESALLNMVVNARDAMPAGGRVLITTRNTRLDEEYAAHHAEVTPGEYALIEVSDSGTGMPPEVVARVFEPFFTTKEQGKGTGLGLAMVFGFVKQSGGHVAIYSEVGQGTTIRLYLPRATLDELPEEEPRPPAAPVRKAGGEAILVVEDDQAVRNSVTKQLSRGGYRVAAAENAAVALALIEDGIPLDLLFTDVVMRGDMNGVELATEVRRRWPSVKVLMTSGFPQGLLGERRTIPEGTELIGKPYRMAELLEKVRALLDRT